MEEEESYVTLSSIFVSLKDANMDASLGVCTLQLLVFHKERHLTPYTHNSPEPLLLKKFRRQFFCETIDLPPPTL